MTIKIIEALNLKGVIGQLPLVCDINTASKPCAVLVGNQKTDRTLMSIAVSGSQTESIHIYSRDYLEQLGLKPQYITVQPYSIAFIREEVVAEPIGVLIVDEIVPLLFIPEEEQIQVVEEIIEEIVEDDSLEDSDPEQYLSDLTKTELIDIANGLGLEFNKSAKKSELIELIESNN